MARVEMDTSVLEGLRSKLGDTVVDRLVDLFRQNVERRLAALTLAREKGDPAGEAAALHSIKGSAQLVGATRLERLATRGESRANDGELEEGVSVSEVQDAFERALAALGKL